MFPMTMAESSDKCYILCTSSFVHDVKYIPETSDNSLRTAGMCPSEMCQTYGWLCVSLCEQAWLTGALGAKLVLLISYCPVVCGQEC